MRNLDDRIIHLLLVYYHIIKQYYKNLPKPQNQESIKMLSLKAFYPLVIRLHNLQPNN